MDIKATPSFLTLATTRLQVVKVQVAAVVVAVASMAARLDQRKAQNVTLQLPVRVSQAVVPHSLTSHLPGTITVRYVHQHLSHTDAAFFSTLSYSGKYKG